jgi:hypothetical protein
MGLIVRTVALLRRIVMTSLALLRGLMVLVKLSLSSARLLRQWKGAVALQAN